MDATQNGDTEKRVTKRLVFVFPGFEPLVPEAQIARFRRAAERSGAVFGADLSFRTLEHDDAGDPAQSRAAYKVAARLTTAASDTPVETRLVFCVWDDLLQGYAAQPFFKRVLRGFGALLAFLFNGTFVRYCRTSWRYALFFMFPIVLTLSILGIGGLFAVTLVGLFSGPTTVPAAIVIGAVTSAILFVIANRRWYLMTALDDWAFAQNLCERSDPAIEKRIATFASVLACESDTDAVDEIVVAAHSLGASFAIPALTDAFESGMAPRVPLHILTVGSSLLKTALHPAGAWQREAVRRLVVDYGVPWTDCQALTDPINFYKSNPSRSLEIAADPEPLVVKLRLKHMVSPATYRRIKRDFFRLHRQFVLAVERRCPYSFHMLLLGPSSIEAFRVYQTVDRPHLVRTRSRQAEESATQPLQEFDAKRRAR